METTTATAPSKNKPPVKMAFFSPSEFIDGAGVDWWPFMDSDLLSKLDAYRRALGFPVEISRAVGAIGRTDGNPHSQHYYSEGGSVKAIDIMPVWPRGGTREEITRAFEIAKQIGFTGIGVYPDWKPRAGLHVDVRAGRVAGNPATWGMVMLNGKQTKIALAEALRRTA